MEEIKVSEMLQADSINKDDSVMIIQEGVNKKASGSIQTATGTSLSLTSVADTCKVKSNSKNLFDENIEQGTVSSTGLNQASTTRLRSVGYIPVEPNTTYTISLTSTNITRVSVSYYTTNDYTTARTNSPSWTNLSATFTTDSTTKYIRFILSTSTGNDDVAVTDVSNIQVEEGSTATDYNPYNTKVIISQNKFDIDSADILQGYFNSTTGAYTSGGNSYVTNNYTEVEEGKMYAVLGATLQKVVLYNESQVVSGVLVTNGSFDIPTGTKYIRIQIQENTSNIVIAEKYQILTLTPQEEKSAFTYDTTTNLTSDGSVTIEYNTKGRVLNNNDTTAIKEYVDKIKEELLENDYDVYSTDEKRVGTWIDGKPLYRKIIQMTLPNATTDGSAVSTTTTVGSVSLDFKRIVCATAITSTSTLSLPFLNAAHHLVKAYFTANRTLNLSNEVVAYNGSAVYIEVEYTKTAD